MSCLKDEIIKTLRLSMEENEYQNPHIISGILPTLDEVYGFEDEQLDEWLSSMWSR